jgi:hypothetical protein
MRWGRHYIHSLLFALVLITAFAHALEMEYISPEQKQKLVEDFEHAKLEKADAVLAKQWTCDMFGVKSRMQVQRSVKLYALSKDALGSIHNTGAQVVANYQLHNGVLSGKNGKFEDNLRMTADGQLISRLTVSHPEPVVIAYSVCKAL